VRGNIRQPPPTQRKRRRQQHFWIELCSAASQQAVQAPHLQHESDQLCSDFAWQVRAQRSCQTQKLSTKTRSSSMDSVLQKHVLVQCF
jgi:hypothetical protein